jgi:hypothetical protein
LLVKHEDHTTFLVLKSQYNPVWERFNVHTLAQNITIVWNEFLNSTRNLNLRATQSVPVKLFGALPRPHSGPDSSDEEGEPAGPLDEAVAGPRELISEEVARFYAPLAQTEKKPLLDGLADTSVPIYSWLNPDLRENEGLLTFWTANRFGRNVHTVVALDVRHAGFCDARWLVSKKRNVNLGDLTNTWKKSVLNAFREHQGELDAAMVES